MEATIRELTPRLTAAVRVKTTIPELGAQFDRFLPEIADRLGELAIHIGGPPFARYHAYGTDGVDVEIGFPLGDDAIGLPALADALPGDVGTSLLPGGDAAVAVHRGLYDGLSAVYDGLRAWIDEQGRARGAGPWESYIDDPSSAESMDEVRTEVVWPLG